MILQNTSYFANNQLLQIQNRNRKNILNFNDYPQLFLKNLAGKSYK
jgi:hypothetical protein